MNDKNWKKHNYGQGQLSFIHLYISEENNTNISNEKKDRTKLLKNEKMTVVWKMMGGKDKENHKFEAGSTQFCFFLDQCQI